MALPPINRSSGVDWRDDDTNRTPGMGEITTSAKVKLFFFYHIFKRRTEYATDLKNLIFLFEADILRKVGITV